MTASRDGTPTPTENQLRLQRECDMALTNLCLATLSKQEGDLREAKRNVNAAIAALVEDARAAASSASPATQSGTPPSVTDAPSEWGEHVALLHGRAAELEKELYGLMPTPRVLRQAKRYREAADFLASVKPSAGYADEGASVAERTIDLMAALQDSLAKEDLRRMNWLGTHLAGTKWADLGALMSIHPNNGEKYLSGPQMLREAIDTARAASQPPASEADRGN